MVHCEIFFNFDFVFPKENITGNVIISASEQSYILQHILIEVIGMADCKWTIDKHLLKPPRIYKKGTRFSGSQEFFLSRHTIGGGNTNVTITNLPQSFPFKTSLPEHLPATWSGQHGKITYIAKTILREPNKPPQVFSKEITVCARRDLKLERHLLCEARQDVSKTYRYGIIGLGDVDVSVWLPICGIAAGQSIPLLCTINNNSSVQFGGLVFVLTQIEIYKSKSPTNATKTYRKDVCRVPRMVDILRGRYEYYCVLETDSSTFPTNQFWRCKSCQVTYEVWVSLQGAVPRYNAFGYPNIDTPGIPIIIGTEPLCSWDHQEITREVMTAVNNAHPPVIMEPLPPDAEVEEMLNNADEDLDTETEHNLARQIWNEPVFDLQEDEGTDP